MFKLLLISLFAIFSGSVWAAADETITHKVFFDVDIDGQPAGTRPIPACCIQQPRHTC